MDTERDPQKHTSLVHSKQDEDKRSGVRNSSSALSVQAADFTFNLL